MSHAAQAEVLDADQSILNKDTVLAASRNAKCKWATPMMNSTMSTSTNSYNLTKMNPDVSIE